METDRSPAGDPLLPLIDAVLAVSVMTDLKSRNLIVQVVSGILGHQLPVEESPLAPLHVISIVGACHQRPNGLARLAEVLERVEPGTRATLEVRRIVDEMTAPENFTSQDRKQLFVLLSGVVIPDLAEIYRFVAGPTAPPFLGQTTYEEMFLSLETLNAGPDGLPKPLVLLEHIAARVRRDLAVELQAWADTQATEMNLVSELRALRRRFTQTMFSQPPQPQSDAYLVFLLERAGPSGDDYRLSHWRQLDMTSAWEPDPGPDFSGSLARVRHHVASLIEMTEMDWARYEPDIVIEFILSSELLNLDVDQWQWETDTHMPQPMGCHFRVCVRSLERMQAGKWHRSWNVRWKELAGQLEQSNAIRPESRHHCQAGDAPALRRLDSQLEAAPELVSLVLSQPPDVSLMGRDELTIAWRAGVPLVLWHRLDCTAQGFLDAVDQLLHEDDAHHVLERVRLLRLNAYAEDSDELVGSNLSVLWDDPTRTVLPGRAGPPDGVSAA
ncbi:MAG: hypothetical protein ABW224_09325 [Kibdelosporangium sp.]